jgi:Concanavalin A-like lectin/glucanases superfamily
LIDSWGIRRAIVLEFQFTPPEALLMFTPLFGFWQQPSPAGPATPPLSDTLRLWLDASVAGSLTQSGGLVSAWADRSGNGNNATQATSGSQPTYNATAQNGLGGVVFTGAQVLDLPTGIADLTASLFAVVRTPIPWQGAAVKIGDQGSGYGLGIGNNTFDSQGLNAVASYDGYGWLAGSTSLSTSNAMILSLIVGGSSGTLYLDAVSQQTISGSPFAPANYASIGGYGGGQRPGRDWYGTICEVVVYPTVLSSDQQSSILSYLSTKWATS